MLYKASVLLAPGYHVSLEDAEVKLLEFFSNDSAQRAVSTWRRENKMLFTLDNWSLSICLQSGLKVFKESQEMADTFGQNHPDRAVIATCYSRFEISCDPDESMAHFNDYILALEQLSSIPGAFVFEDASQEIV